MRQFLLTLVAGALLLFVADRVVGCAARHAYEHTHSGEVGRLNWILDSVDAPVLVFGTSRALHHYVPSVLSDTLGLHVVNCGIEAQGILTNYALLRGILQRYRPLVVIYDLDYHYDIEGGTYTRNPLKVRRMSHLSCRDSLLLAIDPWERLTLWSHIYPYNTVLAEIAASHNMLSEYDHFDVDNGYVPQYHVVDTTMLEPAKPRRMTTDTVKLALLADLVEHLHGNLIFCCSPTYRPVTNVGERLEPAREIAQRYGVPVIEFCSDSAFVGKPELWDDPDHLNDPGARLYSTRVAHAVKQWLQQER